MHPHDPHKKRKLLIIFAVVFVIGSVGIGFRLHSAWTLKGETKDNALVAVSVISPKEGPSEEELVLPGNVQAWHEATIYARTNGYVKAWYTPMGSTVKEGQLLAEIETPEVDAQLRQTEADLKTAEANAKLADSTAVRWKALLKSASVSKQEADEKIGDAMAKDAALASAKANRDHLQELSSFKEVVAPFDGIITSRTLDIGMLVSEGSTTQQPLFRIVQADNLRVYVRVPQNYAARITPDVVAELHVVDHPGEVYKASFLKTAEALDAASRTLLTEFKFENPDNALMAGGYAEVHLKLPSVSKNMRLPVNALIFRSEGLQVGVVDESNHVALKTVTMGRDFGNEVELSSGILPEDKVVINPPDSLSDKQEVRVVAPKVDDKKEGEPAKDAKKS